MNELEYVTLNPSVHINPYLTHWTGRKKSENDAFEILKLILKTQRLRFSDNSISMKGDKMKVSTSMICFTDTPILQSLEHCQVYNYFGISFNKEALIQYGANPVFYFVKPRKLNIELANKSRYENDNKQFHHSTLTSYFQPYKSGKSQFPEFKEREWRINRLLPYDWVGETIQEYNFKGKVIKEKRKRKTKNYTHYFYLPFRKKIIENIIVPKGYEDEIKIILEELKINCKIYVINN